MASPSSLQASGCPWWTHYLLCRFRCAPLLHSTVFNSNKWTRRHFCPSLQTTCGITQEHAARRSELAEAQAQASAKRLVKVTRASMHDLVARFNVASKVDRAACISASLSMVSASIASTETQSWPRWISETLHITLRKVMLTPTSPLRTRIWSTAASSARSRMELSYLTEAVQSLKVSTLQSHLKSLTLRSKPSRL